MKKNYLKQIANQYKEAQTMKNRSKSNIPVSVAIALLLCTRIPFQAFAQKKSSAMKIGTHDSRIIAFAWSRTDYLRQQMGTEFQWSFD
jgi:hypothetical protein